MGQRSKVQTLLPDEVRAELDRRLIAGGFANYGALERWLRKEGYELGKSSIHRHGTKLEERMSKLKAATDQAKALVAASPDDTDAMSQATMRLLQERLFSLLRDMDELDPNSVDLPKIARAMAPLVRASIAQKTFDTEVRERARQAAENVDKLTRAGGMSAEAADEIRRSILGIAA